MSSEKLKPLQILKSVLYHHFELRTRLHKDYIVVMIYDSSLKLQSFKGMYGPQEIGDHTYFTMDFSSEWAMRIFV
jgi:hypothetical protein